MVSHPDITGHSGTVLNGWPVRRPWVDRGPAPPGRQSAAPASDTRTPKLEVSVLSHRAPSVERARAGFYNVVYVVVKSWNVSDFGVSCSMP
jgi:hypothetical protein